MSKNKITRLDCITKYLFQCFLILVEFGGISFAFAYFTSFILPCENVIAYLERGVLGLALYEFIIFVILEAINDGRRDSLIALKFAYNTALLACEEDSPMLYEKVHQFIEKQLDAGMLNSVQIRQEYEILRMLIERKNTLELKYRHALVERECNAADLRWRFTLLLRLFK